MFFQEITGLVDQPHAELTGWNSVFGGQLGREGGIARPDWGDANTPWVKGFYYPLFWRRTGKCNMAKSYCNKPAMPIRIHHYIFVKMKINVQGNICCDFPACRLMRHGAKPVFWLF